MLGTETMVHALTEFVAIPSVTASEPHREFCRQAAIWLQASLAQLGAEACLVRFSAELHRALLADELKSLYCIGGSYRLPLTTKILLSSVYSIVHPARPRRWRVFSSTGEYTHSQTLLHPRPVHLFSFRKLRHYDVIAAPPQASTPWRTPPFTLTGVNGYLYGRGVTDNKGPIIASACAAATLLARRELDCDVVFLIEGEEEAGSGGFAESVRKYKVCSFKVSAFPRCPQILIVSTGQKQIGDIDAILLR